MILVRQIKKTNGLYLLTVPSMIVVTAVGRLVSQVLNGPDKNRQMHIAVKTGPD